MQLMPSAEHCQQDSVPGNDTFWQWTGTSWPGGRATRQDRALIESVVRQSSDGVIISSCFDPMPYSIVINAAAFHSICC
jgi:hypothetical protein